MTAAWLPPWALIIVFQVVTASASIGRISTSNYIVSRAVMRWRWVRSPPILQLNIL